MENNNENCFLLISVTSVNVCRICAQSLTNLKSIYDFNSNINPMIKIEEMLRYLEVPIEDYPKEICSICEYDLCASFLFKLKLDSSKIIFESQAPINSNIIIPTSIQPSDLINIISNETNTPILNFEISKMDTSDIFNSLNNYQKKLPKNDNVIQNSYKCFICKSTFATKDNFMSHFRIHTNQYGYYRCFTCELKFDKVVLAQYHGRAHENIFMSCQKCGKKSKDVFEITNHYCHKKRNIYFCSICKMFFAKKVNFDNHKLQTHEFKTLCDQCGIEVHNFEYHVCDE